MEAHAEKLYHLGINVVTKIILPIKFLPVMNISYMIRFRDILQLPYYELQFLKALFVDISEYQGVAKFFP